MDRLREFRNFVVEDYLDDCEADDLQASVPPKHSPPSAGVPCAAATQAAMIAALRQAGEEALRCLVLPDYRSCSGRTS